MSEDKTIKSTDSSVDSSQAEASVKPVVSESSNGAAATVAKDLYGNQNGNQKNSRSGSQGGQGGQGGQNSRGGRSRGGRDSRGTGDEMEQRILEIARVTRVMAGGKRMNFRACVAIGDKKGNVGVGLGKGADVTIAVNKAVNKAKKNMVNIPLVNETIPHVIFHKMGAARIMLKPAKQGRGVISGGVTRVILELAGVKNITSKNLGSKSKINNARCVIEALRGLRKKDLKDNKSEVKEIKDNKNEIKTETAEIKK